MPKMKTHKGAKKRFKVTGTGKVMRRRAGKGHLLSGKSSKRRRKLRKDAVINDVASWRVRRLLGE
jgi:large subunit ribosomal protein L35